MYVSSEILFGTKRRLYLVAAGALDETGPPWTGADGESRKGLRIGTWNREARGDARPLARHSA